MSHRVPYLSFIVPRVIITGSGPVTETLNACKCDQSRGVEGAVCSECGGAILTVAERAMRRQRKRRMAMGLPADEPESSPVTEEAH